MVVVKYVVAITLFIAAVLSVVLLLKGITNWELINFFEFLLEYYDKQFLGVLLEFVRPHLQALADALAAWIGWDIPLADHWRHVTAVLALYVSRDALVIFSFAWNSHIRPDVPGAITGYLLSAALRFLIGLLIAVFFGGLMGLITLVSGDTAADTLLVSIPIVGVWFYWQFTAWLGAVFHRAHFAKISGDPITSFGDEWATRRKTASVRATWGLLVGLASVLVVDHICPERLAFTGAGLAILFGMIFLLGVYWWHQGLNEVHRLQASRGIDFASAALVSRNFALGRSMVQVIIGAVLAFFISAVLMYFGIR